MKSKMIFAVLILAGIFAIGATTGVKTLPGNTKNTCLQIVYTADMNDTETITFFANGKIQRIVVDCNAVDADGDMTISDISDVNWLSWDNVFASGDIDLVPESTGESGASYGSVRVAGTNTMTLTNCKAIAPATFSV